MDIQPDFLSFETGFAQGTPQLLWLKIPSDLETPISASLKLMEENQPFFLLESVEGGTNRGRYSIIGMDPDLVWRCDDHRAEIAKDSKNFTAIDTPPLESLRQLHQSCQFPVPDGLPPMAAGLIGYLSYDAIRFTETTVGNNNPDTIGIPVGMFMRPRLMVIFDSVTSSIFVVTSLWPNQEKDAKTAYKNGKERLLSVTERLKKQQITSMNVEGQPNISFTSNMSQQAYHAMVQRAKEYIFAGDIFQVVPSQRFKSRFDLPPFALYRSLRHLNPSPFMFFLQLGDFQLVGASPEILVRLRDNKVTIRPLAGTRRRGKDAEEDKKLAADLLGDEKEIAEHLMLIDLSRNDVGRVTIPGSVKVTEEMVIEYYSHVMHISSNVEGELAPGFDALDALFSGLPVGTVSGAPKVRAMQIIDELETEKRSFYAGCVGYFAADGTMDTCITLRTGLIKDNTLYVQAGGGVVADSVEEDEYQESCNKAKALMKAAEKAHEFI